MKALLRPCPTTGIICACSALAGTIIKKNPKSLEKDRNQIYSEGCLQSQEHLVMPLPSLVFFLRKLFQEEEGAGAQ